MKKDKLKKRELISLPAVESLLAELREFEDEFDATDPGCTEVLLAMHISNLISRKIVKARWWRKNLRLDDIFRSILKSRATDDLIERVQMFQDLTNDYRGEPSKEDMAEAQEILNELIAGLDKYVQDAKK